MSHVSSRGDTIIEVLLAVTIFSLVAVGGVSVMNQGLAIAQRALEIDLVRMQMDTQADLLRFISSQSISDSQPTEPGSWREKWEKIIDNPGMGSVQKFDDMVDSNGVTCKLPSNKFALSTSQSALIRADPFVRPVTQADTYAMISDSAAKGIWIQGIKDSANGTDFYDFHIRACWNTSGQSRPITLGTIVRLYAPAQ